jgi:hypothetical protein
MDLIGAVENGLIISVLGATQRIPRHAKRVIHPLMVET